MYNETTLYIKENLLEKLDNAAKELNISRSKLVSILLVTYLKKNKSIGKAFITLKYQKSDTKVKFKTKNLCLRMDIYEKWVDVRKLFKLSASFIIALSIEEYLDEIVEGRNEPYNYFSMYYTKVTYIENVCINITMMGEVKQEILEKITGIAEMGEKS